MKLLMLKFTYGVEVGAHLAYLGHYTRTKDLKVLSIAYDEDLHKKQIAIILRNHKTKPSLLINSVFFIIGNIVRYLCYISPKFLLNKVATTLELFAVFSYKELAKRFPDYKKVLEEMEETEQAHANYFTLGKVQCEDHQRKSAP